MNILVIKDTMRYLIFIEMHSRIFILALTILSSVFTHVTTQHLVIMIDQVYCIMIIIKLTVQSITQFNIVEHDRVFPRLSYIFNPTFIIFHKLNKITMHYVKYLLSFKFH